MRQYAFPARKDLIDLIKSEVDTQIEISMTSNPKRWLDELDFFHFARYGEHMPSRLVKDRNPPLAQAGWVNYGTEACRYKGQDIASRGLWIKESEGWRVYDIGSVGTVNINDEFQNISPTELLPSTLIGRAIPMPKSKDGEEISKKRLIGNIKIRDGENMINSVVKGEYFEICRNLSGENISNERATNVSFIWRVGAEKEMNFGNRLSAKGVKIPRIIGFYESCVEDRIFMDKIEGKFPNAYFETHRPEIVEQDARMLGGMCLAGLVKGGFCDFDDKIFDGKNLHLIDFDECADFSKVVGGKINSLEQNFRQSLRDALCVYKNSLLNTEEATAHYIKEFYKTVGWPNPSRDEISALSRFGPEYRTRDQQAFGDRGL